MFLPKRNTIGVIETFVNVNVSENSKKSFKHSHPAHVLFARFPKLPISFSVARSKNNTGKMFSLFLKWEVKMYLKVDMWLGTRLSFCSYRPPVGGVR